jgi:hypothetical protein
MAVEPRIVWELLVDTSRWAEWGPSVATVETADVRLRAHATGRVCTPIGLSLPFVVTEFTEGQSWSWSVAGVPATTHTVEPVPGGCRVTFGVPAVAAPYTLVCRLALRRIEELARAADPP